MESQLIYFNSALDMQNSNRSHMIVNFSPEMKLNPKKKHYLRLLQSKIPVSVYNISSAIGNHKLKYRMTDGGEEKTITIADGVYINGLREAIKYYLRENGDYTSAGDPPSVYNTYPFLLYGNDLTGHCYLAFDQADRHVDLTCQDGGSATSTLYDTLGWEESDIDIDSTDGLYQVSPNMADFGGSNQSFYIRCNLVQTRDTGRMNDIIYYSAFSGEPFTPMMVPESNYDILIPLKEEYQTRIDKCEIKICNIDGELLTFNGSTNDSEIYITLAIVSVSPD